MSMNCSDFVDQTVGTLIRAGYAFHDADAAPAPGCMPEGGHTFTYTDADGDVETSEQFDTALQAQAGALAHFFDMAWTFIER